MELLGGLVAGAIVVIGIGLFAKHSRVIGYWINTPNYTKEYAIKMLKRQIEDCEEEILYLEEKK